MNVPCKQVHLYDRDPDSFALCKLGIRERLQLVLTKRLRLSGLLYHTHETY